MCYKFHASANSPGRAFTPYYTTSSLHSAEHYRTLPFFSLLKTDSQINDLVRSSRGSYLAVKPKNFKLCQNGQNLLFGSLNLGPFPFVLFNRISNSTELNLSAVTLLSRPTLLKVTWLRCWRWWWWYFHFQCLKQSNTIKRPPHYLKVMVKNWWWLRWRWWRWWRWWR